MHLKNLPSGTGKLKYVWAYSMPMIVEGQKEVAAKCIICAESGNNESIYKCTGGSVSGIRDHLRR